MPPPVRETPDMERTPLRERGLTRGADCGILPAVDTLRHCKTVDHAKPGKFHDRDGASAGACMRIPSFAFPDQAFQGLA